MPFPLLPKLQDGTGPRNLARNGEWFKRDEAELANVATILDVNVPNVEINSIPTVWARPLLFQMALYSPHHKLHKQIVAEWRGLLALFALHEIKDLPLSVVSIDLSKAPDARNATFHAGLKELIPHESLAADTSWEHLYVILYNQKPIGLTSPTTLVATATDYSYSGIEVSWFDGKRLNDPVSTTLSKVEKNGLRSWLANLHGQIDQRHAQAKFNGDLLIDLRDAIGNFELSLEIDSLGFTRGRRNLGINGQSAGIFSLLDSSADKPGEGEIESAVKLIGTRKAASDVDLLVIDPNIARDWLVPPAKVPVIGATTLADLGLGGHQRGQHNRFAGQNLNQAEAWNSYELFSDRLLVIRNDANAFRGALAPTWIGNSLKYQNMEASIVVPINKKLLEFYEAEELQRRLTFEHTQNNELKVRLRLTLAGIGGERRDFTAERVYIFANTEDLEVIDSLPILDAFPNFSAPNWKANYIAYSTDQKDRTFEVMPVAVIAERSSIPNGSSGKRMIWRTESYPEALECFRGDQSVGVLLLKTPEKINDKGSTCIVGVDFGASGTCVYYGDGNGGNPQPLTFENRKVTVTNKTADQSRETFGFFLPDIGVDAPFLSLFQPFHGAECNGDTGNRGGSRPILEGHVFYFETNIAGNVVANLKWSGDASMRQYVTSFLTQLAVQIAAEMKARGFRELLWRFSYPTAFNSVQAYEYSNTVWREVIREVNSMCGISSQPAMDLSESLAAARYFRKHEAALTEDGAVFVDIGSSTSDISVWQNDKPIIQSSLKFAGRELFLNYLINNPKVLTTLLGNRGNADQIHLGEATDPVEKRWAAIDLILRGNRTEIFDSYLPKHSATPEVKSLRTHLAFGLGGLVFYLGLVVKALIDEQNFEPMMPRLYFGGNGALMFRWLTDGGDLKAHPTAPDFFERIFKSALATKPRGAFSIEMTTKPKHEASQGLVHADVRGDTTETVKAVIAGETFKVGTTTREWDKRIGRDDFSNGVSVPELSNLATYIDVFNRECQNANLCQRVDAARHLNDVAGLVSNSLGDLRRQTADEIIVEPIFMIALKHLVEKMR